MQAVNPLVPPQLGSSGGAPTPVANAPFVPDSTKHETSRPVTASREGERARSDGGRPRGDAGDSRAHHRGGQVDISV